MAWPIPNIQKAIEFPDLEQKNCRIFVSYSHKDSEDAKQFMINLKLELRGTPQLGISPDQVFFDRNKLLAGDEWDDSIQSALEEADYFVFLISANSLDSEYCYSRELAIAAQNKLPIIQIVLDYCSWDTQPIPNDPQERKLGDLGALPKDDSFSLKPIAAWSDKERGFVWTEVVKQLARRLSKEQKHPATSHLFNSLRIKTKVDYQIGPLLPYFCNQNTIVNEFSRGIKTWERSALLILAKGLSDDDIPHFWDRLRNDDLSDYLKNINERLNDERPFKWLLRGDQLIDSAEMMMFLSDSLADSKYRLKDVNSLSDWLAALPGVVPLTATLPRGEPKKILSHGIRTLLKLFDDCAPETPLNRLVIAILIEDENLIKRKNLCEFLNLTGYRRTVIVELTPLKPIDQEDVRIWHRQKEIEKLGCIDEETLLNRIFDDPSISSLRMRLFAKKFNQIFGR